MKLKIKILLLFLSVSVLIGAPSLWFGCRAMCQVDMEDVETKGVKEALELAERIASSMKVGREASLLPFLQSTQVELDALYVAAIDANGRFLAHTNVAETGRVSRDPEMLADLRLERAHAHPSRYKNSSVMEVAAPVWSESQANPDEDFMLGATRKGRLGIVRLSLPLDPILKRERRFFLRLGQIALLTGISGILLGYYFMRRLIRPIQWLSVGTAHIAKGEYGVTVPILSNDEIGDLAKNFNQMSQVLSETTVSKRTLEESQKQLMEAQRLAHIGSYRSSPNLDLIAWSHEVYRIFGRDPNLPPPMGEEVKALFNPESWIQFFESRNEALRSGKAYEIDLEVVRPDGAKRWITLRGEAVCDSDGRRVGISGTVQDITERKAVQMVTEQKEKYFRSLIENTSDIITVLDLDSTIRYESPSISRVLGFRPEEIQGTSAFQWIHPEDHERVRQALGAAAANPGTVSSCEYRFKQKDGSWRILDSLGIFIADDGAGARLVVNSRDITDRRKTESELSQSRQMLQSILDSIPQRVFWKDRNIVYLGCNRAFANDAGLRDPAEIVGKTDFDLAWKATAELYRGEDRRVMDQDSPKLNFEEPQDRPNGGQAWLRTNKLPLHDLAGQVSGVVGTYEDISASREMEDALRESESKVRLLLDSAAEGIFGMDLQGTITFANQACARSLGFQHPGELLNKNAHALMHHSRADGSPYPLEECRIAQAVISGQEGHADTESYWRADGTSFSVESWVHPTVQAGKIVGAVASFIDISKRKHAQQQRALLSAAIEQSQDAIVITDVKGTIEYVNHAFENVTGYTRLDAVGKNPRILNSGKQDRTLYETMWAELTAGRVWAGVLINKRKDGTLFEEEACICPVTNDAGVVTNYVAVKRDIAERRKLEAIVRNSDKMAAVGQLAAGVAHEINNPLGVILGFAQAGVRRLRPDDPLDLPLKSIEREALRCKNLVQDLLTFSRTSKLDREPVDINRIVTSALSLIGAQTKIAHIDLRQELVPDLPPVLGQANQLQQVVINLANNALDALGDAGCLTFKTEVQTDGPLSWVCLSVIDDGPGIPPGVLPRIFEPFFTTKPVGKGTGLGLSLIHEIVAKHSGTMDVKSIPGHTEFRIRFPVRRTHE